MAKENFLTVVVRRGTLVVDKATHAIGAEVKLLEEEAKRLIGLGVVSALPAKAGTAAPASQEAAAPAPGVPAVKIGVEGPQLTSSDGPSVTQTQA